MVEREIRIMDEKENWVTTASGFKTRNACADVTAQTIETWFKHASGGFDKVSGMENLKKLLEREANYDWADISEMLGISSVRSYLHSLFRHEFWFTGHNGFAGTALRQFISCPFRTIRILDIRYDKLFHNALDEGRFSRSHRANHTNINIAAGSGSDVGVKIFHSQPP